MHGPEYPYVSMSSTGCGLHAAHFTDKKSVYETVRKLLYYSLKSMQALVQDFASHLEEKPEVHPKLGCERNLAWV